MWISRTLDWSRRPDYLCGYGGGHVRTATVREFRDQATKLLRETELLLVTRRGRILDFYLPATGTSLPLEIKKELFYALTRAIRRRMKVRGVTEETILADFEQTRKARCRR